MSLVRAELRRLAKRRFTRWMLVLVVGLMATVAVTVAVTHQQPGPEVLAQAEAAAQREFEDQQRWMEEEIAECEQAQQSGDAEAADRWPADCEEIREWYPSVDEMAQWHLPPSFNFRGEFPGMISLLVGLLGLFGFIVGSSFVGAEWRTGGMMNLLLWRPRRLPVLGAKLTALLGTLSGLAVLLGAAWTGGLWLVASFRGITDTMTVGAWQSFGLTGLRGLALVLAAGTVGFALASIGRHTAAAMGVAIGAFVVGVVGVGMVAGAMLQIPFWEAGLWTTYLTAWLEKSVELTDWQACNNVVAVSECQPPTMEITWQVAGVGIAAVVALVLGAALWQLRRRDVT